ncbi:kinase-like domain-containing protein [Dendryphion nanum]|uniref:Kinase-like domain-containing protein n=1 Tax=Dendryphion nanum TaxID=256645 RepID=A0A9P9D0C2_9PLEO|nr:kinase-like domain-containing protein [Dendryphion nanum]
MVVPRLPERRFVPDNALKPLLCREAVVAALEEQKSELETDISILAAFVCNRARKLFAMLACNSNEAAIEYFYELGFGDEKLPIEIKITQARDLGESDIEEESDIIETGWSYMNLEDFAYSQWLFLSPTFFGNNFRYQFDYRTRMPFINYDSLSQREGQFSVVEQWRVHRDHLQLGRTTGIHSKSDEHPYVAIKELKTFGLHNNTFKAVAEELATTLEKVRELDHPHLIKAIAYYKKGDRHYVMFPWATQGNLQDFWNRGPYTLDPGFFEWVFTQLCGVAEAIERLHGSNNPKLWRHLNLKPEKILCFDNDSTQDGSCVFVITFVASIRVDNRIISEMWEGHISSRTLMYDPPEAELQPHLPKSRQYDIWSIGCIYLEFIIWLLYGTKELQHFRDDLCGFRAAMRFYVVEEVQNTRTKTAQLNSAVQKWIDWIRKDPRCPEQTAIRSLIELVVKRLLVTDVGRISSFSHTYSTLREGELTAQTNSIKPSIIRTSTSSGHFDLFDDASAQVRATAKEMNHLIKQILGDATSRTSKRLEWMKWDAPTQQGPRRYGPRLNPLDAGVL